MHTFAPPGASLRPRLDPNERGRDLVVGDVHGHFATLRHALAELEVGEHDRVFSLGDLVDRGPDSFEAKDWIARPKLSTRFHVVLRGNHEQMMLEALIEGPPKRRPRLRDQSAWSLWMMNGGGWWKPKSPYHGATAWIDVLSPLPFCARVDTRHGPVGLVHACPVWPSWEELEAKVVGDRDENHRTRERALWSRVRHGYVQRELGETGEEHLGPVESVRCVVTGHTPRPAPVWHENVLAIDTGVHIDDRGYGHLTIARIDGKEIETFRFARRKGGDRAEHDPDDG